MKNTCNRIFCRPTELLTSFFLRILHSRHSCPSKFYGTFTCTSDKLRYHLPAKAPLYSVHKNSFYHFQQASTIMDFPLIFPLLTYYNKKIIFFQGIFGYNTWEIRICIIRIDSFRYGYPNDFRSLVFLGRRYERLSCKNRSLPLY